MCFQYTLLVFIVFLESLVFSKTVTVTTSVGKISGATSTVTVDGVSRHVTKFLGIPYGEPTMGDNRFRKPIPKANFSSTFYAVHSPPSCDSGSSHFSEDCLYLNIYVPGNFSTLTSYPVMIYIHGGAFQVGSSSDTPGDALSVYGRVIVVTINYRLGIFGFLHSSDGSIEGNFGLWDQHLAIKWVHDNIAPFQGNADLVTIFGESAGSKSVIYQSLYAENQGLFKRAIAESGSAVSYRAINLDPNADEVLAKAGCHSNSYTCLRAKSADSLRQLHFSHPDLKFLPTVDGVFVVEKPYDIIYGNHTFSSAAKTFFASLDTLSGVNMYDGGLFMATTWPNVLHQSRDTMNVNKELFQHVVVPWIVNDAFKKVSDALKARLETALLNFYTKSGNPELRKEVVDATSDVTYFRSTLKTVIGHRRLNVGRTYLYEFAVVPTYHVITAFPSWLQGANHADDVPFVFGEPISPVKSYRSHYSPENAEVSRAVMTLWTNFAKTGNPNSPNDVIRFLNTTWPEYDLTSQFYLKITNQLSESPLQQRFNEDRMKFWLETIPSILSSGGFNPISGIVG